MMHKWLMKQQKTSIKKNQMAQIFSELCKYKYVIVDNLIIYEEWKRYQVFKLYSIFGIKPIS